jgi:hypothetical protein
MATAAARQRRRRRERERAGKILITVEAPEVELIEALKLAGFLDPNRADDPVAIQAALQRVVELWAVTRDDIGL